MNRDFKAAREMFFIVLIAFLSLLISSDGGPKIGSAPPTLCSAAVRAQLSPRFARSAYFHQLTKHCPPSSP